MRNQITITNSIEITGKALFSGEDVTLIFRPAEPDTGIVFVRSDLNEPVRIPLHIDSVAHRPRRTAVTDGSVAIETVEHCLAAVHALGVDNLIIELNGGELPNIDGSCEPFAAKLLEAGFTELDKPREVFVIEEPVTIKNGDAVLYALPDKNDQLSIIYDLHYQHPLVGRQLYQFNLTVDAFMKDIAPARTFVLESEAREFQAHGIGKHLTGRDVLVLAEEGPIDNEFRYTDECVRHKIGDLLGDLMLLGRPVFGRIVAYRSGHQCNQALVRELNTQIQKQLHKRKLRAAEPLLDIRKIQKILPHRYPFLLVDRVIEIEGDRRAVGIKNVTMNELFFQGHFPGQPIMPGVLILEALAQMSGLLFAQRLEHTGQLAVLLSMDKCKMRKPVVPGDQLILDVEAVRIKNRTGDCRCKALVGDTVVAEAQIRFILVDADPV